MKTRFGSVPLLMVLGFLLAASVAPGQSSRNMALDLDGRSSYIRLPALPQAPTNLTMEGWVFLRDYGNNSPLFTFANGCQSNLIVGGVSDGTSGRAFIKVGTSMLIAPEPTPTNVWNHLAFVLAYQGELLVSASIYLNGVEKGNRVLSGMAPVVRASNAVARTWCVEGGYLAGTIDEIRLWAKALSPTDIQRNMTKSLTGLENGLLAYWRLDDGTGWIATDSSTQGLHGALLGRAVWVDSTAPMEPVAVTLPADGLTPTTALLHGQVGAYNADTVAWFEWGTSTDYRNTVGLTNLAGATGLFSWAAPLAGLSPLTTYHLRAVASNGLGLIQGSDRSFTTLPSPAVVTTLPATQITTSRATLQGTVNPSGVAASAWFEWGASSLYGNATARTNLDAVTGVLAVAGQVTGLVAGTSYSYRLVLTNSSGIFCGRELSLATLSATNAALADLGIGQVTLSPPFDPSILNYSNSTTVSNGTPLLTLTVTSADDSATMTARLLPSGSFWPVTSSVPTSFGPVVAGTNLFEIRVVSRDNSLTNLYTALVWCEPGPPIVWTVTPRLLDIYAANLVANVTPNGALTTVWFEWGLTTNYGNLSSCTNLLSPYRSQTLMYAKALALVPYTNYHCRAVASNTVGVTYGGDVTFATAFFTEAAHFDHLWSAELGYGGWADYDGDAYLDLILAGPQNWGSDLSRLIPNSYGSLRTGGENLLPHGLRNGALAWGDYDNDNNPDLLTTGLIDLNQEQTSYLYGSALFRKRGNYWMVGSDPGLPGLMLSSVAWGDFDNDGDQDVLMTGRDSNQVAHTALYLNGQYGIFAEGSPGLPQVFWGCAAPADYDNDGALDVFLSGYDYSASHMGLYHNDGGGHFLPVPVEMTNLFLKRVAWGDYDNDGLLDLVAGADLYRNLGHGAFERKASVIEGSYYAGAWGDFDNDGDLDVVSGGQVYRNNGDGTFTPLQALTNVLGGDFAAWADFDKDGDLDLVAHGWHYWLLFRNNSVVSNTPPTEPSGLSVEISGTKATFRWNAASDAQTPSPGLTYNLRVGITPQGTQRVSPLANVTTGRLRMPQMGNAGPRLFSWLTNLQPGVVYYWSVQAVDTAFAASRFAPEQTFALAGPPAIDPISAGSASSSSVVLLARVFSGGKPASVWYEWGATTLYGNTTASLSAGSNLTAILLRQPLSGLQPGTLYHYRVLAANSLGTNAGPDQTVYTDPALVPGDTNQDGVVDQSELQAVADHYWTQANPPVITNLAILANGLFLTGLSNTAAWNFSVLASTNLTNWDYLGPAWSVLQFRDSKAVGQPARFYRLRWP